MCPKNAALPCSYSAIGGARARNRDVSDYEHEYEHHFIEHEHDHHDH